MPLDEWLKNKKKQKYLKVESTNKVDVPEGAFIRCPSCRQVLSHKELGANFKVCPACNYHFSMEARERISSLVDEGSFKEFGSSIVSKDPLNFVASKSYSESLKEAQVKTGLKEAEVCGYGSIDGHEVVLSVLDFGFIGGSMGSAVGEKVTRAIEKATQRKLPLVIVSASGGARMQEGMLSLMQMAKTCAALARFHEKKLLYISLLTHPTTGGVMASFAALADIILAEPGALIGFAGPRVIEDTIKQKLPPGFQRAEFLLKHGMVDKVVSRKELKDTLSRLLEFFSKS